MVYLDYNATTPLAPEVIKTITESLTDAWGNPSSTHEAGLKARDVIVTARKHVAHMIGAKASDIIFTSGGTEGNNWILQTALEHFYKSRSDYKNMGDCDRKDLPPPHFITTNIEHDSIKLVLEAFQNKEIAEVTFVPVQHDTGCVAVSDVVAAIRPSTIMITVMLANNETGVIQPVSEICHKVRSLQKGADSTGRILLHTDAAQALGKIPVNVEDLGVDYLTIVGHKFYAPRIGAIFARNPEKDTPMYPMLFGGGQERNLRPGTENTPMIAGLGRAAELVCDNLDKYQSHMADVRDYLEGRLQKCFGDSVTFNGKFSTSQRLPNTCNVSFTKTELKGHEILSKVPSLQASVGAACHAQDRPSHILQALGIPNATAWRAVRISVGRETTREDIDTVVQGLETLFNSRDQQ